MVWRWAQHLNHASLEPSCCKQHRQQVVGATHFGLVLPAARLLVPEQREQNHFANVLAAREQHDQAIDADTLARRRWQARPAVHRQTPALEHALWC